MEVIYESEKGFKSGPIVITFAEGFYCECKTFLLVVKNGFSNAVISFGATTIVWWQKGVYFLVESGLKVPKSSTVNSSGRY